MKQRRQAAGGEPVGRGGTVALVARDSAAQRQVVVARCAPRHLGGWGFAHDPPGGAPAVHRGLTGAVAGHDPGFAQPPDRPVALKCPACELERALCCLALSQLDRVASSCDALDDLLAPISKLLPSARPWFS